MARKGSTASSRGGGGVGASNVRFIPTGAAQYLLQGSVQQPRYAVAGREWTYPVRVTADGGFLSGTDHRWEFFVPSFETIRNVIDGSLNSHPMAAQIREDSLQVEARAYSESTKQTKSGIRGFGDDLFKQRPPWNDLTEGLRTVSAVVERLERDGSSLQVRSTTLPELRTLAAAFNKALEYQTQFSLIARYGRDDAINTCEMKKREGTFWC